MTDHTPLELLDGWRHPFVSPLLVLGQPTRDGRMLAADGSFTLYDQEVPVASTLGVLSPLLPPEGVWGIVAGVFRRGHVLFAVGAADYQVALGLNEESLRLAADLDAMMLKADMSVIKQAVIRGARVVNPEQWAWS